MPAIVGALRLLAESYTPASLNIRGFSLYAEFRPVVEGWGSRGEVKCSKILSLRNPELKKLHGPINSNDVVKIELLTKDTIDAEERESKRTRRQESPTKDEYDAALDDDIFNDADLSSLQ